MMPSFNYVPTSVFIGVFFFILKTVSLNYCEKQEMFVKHSPTHLQTSWNVEKFEMATMVARVVTKEKFCQNWSNSL